MPKRNQRVVTAKWVLTRTIDGQPAKLKARRVAMGFNPRHGIHYKQLFSSLTQKNTLQFFLALVNPWDLHCDQVDSKAAFHSGELEEII
jgi:hypothetical protein